MKHALVAIALFLFSAQSFAQDFRHHDHNNNNQDAGAAIAGAFIGGIFDLIQAKMLEDQGYGRDDYDYGDDDWGNDGDGWHHGHDHGRGDGWGRDHGRRHRGLVTCYAQNGRGQYFAVKGQMPRLTQSRAMAACYEVSRRCVELGCRF